MKAVETWYIPATERKPRRIAVVTEGRRSVVTIPEVPGGSDEDVFRAVLEETVVKWWGHYATQGLVWHPGGGVRGGIVWVAEHIRE